MNQHVRIRYLLCHQGKFVLARDFAAYIHNVWIQMKTQTNVRDIALFDASAWMLTQMTNETFDIVYFQSQDI